MLITCQPLTEQLGGNNVIDFLKIFKYIQDTSDIVNVITINSKCFQSFGRTKEQFAQIYPSLTTINSKLSEN